MSNPESQSDLSSSSDCPPCPGRPVLERIASKAAEIGPEARGAAIKQRPNEATADRVNSSPSDEPDPGH